MPFLRFARNRGSALSFSLVTALVLGGCGDGDGHAVKLASFVVDPPTRDFGAVTVGADSKADVIRVTNTGQAAGMIGAVTLTGDDFAFGDKGADSCSNKDVAVGASCEVSAVFRPKSTGGKSATLSFGPGVAAILSGTGQDVGLAFAAATLSLGDVAVGGMAAGSLTLVNNGDAPVTSLMVRSEGATDQFLLANDCAMKDLTGAARSCKADVHCKPTRAGRHQITVTATSLHATAMAVVDCVGLNPASLAFGPVAHEFPPTGVGAASEATFILSNAGDVLTGPVIISVGTDFVVVTSDCADGVAPRSTCAITAAFKPSTPGEKKGSLKAEVATPGGPSATATLGGKALIVDVLSLSKNSKAFGMVAIGQSSASETFTITNIGSVDAGPFVVRATGPFVIDGDKCSGVNLSPMATCTVTAKFSPASGGVATGTLTVSDPKTTLVAMLSGTGTLPAVLAVTPPTFDFGTLLVDQTSASQDFVVTNTGATATAPVMVKIVDELASTDRSPFTFVKNGCNGKVLAPADSCTVVVAVKPLFEGTFAAALSATAGVLSVASQLKTRALHGDPGTLTIDTFSSVVGVESPTQTLRISNSTSNSSGTIAITIVGSGAQDFIIKSTTCPDAGLAPMSACVVVIAFKPSKADRAIMAVIVLTASLGGTLSTLLIGNGLAPFEIARIDCANSTVITTAPETFDDTAVGGGAKEGCFKVIARTKVDAFQSALSSGNPSHFIFSPQSAVGVIPACGDIVPGTNSLQLLRTAPLDGTTAAAACAIRVRFTPQAKGRWTETITANASAGVTATAWLAGNGI